MRLLKQGVRGSSLRSALADPELRNDYQLTVDNLKRRILAGLSAGQKKTLPFLGFVQYVTLEEALRKGSETRDKKPGRPREEISGFLGDL